MPRVSLAAYHNGVRRSRLCILFDRYISASTADSDRRRIPTTTSHNVSVYSLREETCDWRSKRR